jgi:hypothetical protein
MRFRRFNWAAAGDGSSPGRSSSTTPRVLTLAGATVVAVCGALSLGAAPASAVPGLEMVPSPVSATNSLPSKTVVAYCPPGKRVIGGGGRVQEIGPITRKPALTQLRPLQQYNGPRDAYMVTAAETTPGTTGDWWVQAYAMCANPLPGLHIVQATTSESSQPIQATAAVCPSGERVIGTGGRVSTSTGDSAYVGEVVLQVARPSGPGDIARVQAHEDANGFSLPWSVTAYAICAATPPGYKVEFGESLERDSESTKLAFANCTGGRRLHSSGAAITNVAPGNVSLQRIFPDLDGGETQALAVENTPTIVDWDFIVATAICAY